jgi:hypothetical protein
MSNVKRSDYSRTSGVPRGMGSMKHLDNPSLQFLSQARVAKLTRALTELSALNNNAFVTNLEILTHRYLSHAELNIHRTNQDLAVLEVMGLVEKDVEVIRFPDAIITRWRWREEPVNADPQPTPNQSPSTNFP